MEETTMLFLTTVTVDDFGSEYSGVQKHVYDREALARDFARVMSESGLDRTETYAGTTDDESVETWVSGWLAWNGAGPFTASASADLRDNDRPQPDVDRPQPEDDDGLPYPSV